QPDKSGRSFFGSLPSFERDERYKPTSFQNPLVLLDSCLDCFHQTILGRGLASQGFQYLLVHRFFRNNMMHYNPFRLTLPMKPGNRLLIVFKTPSQPKPDNDVPAGLEVQPVPA